MNRYERKRKSNNNNLRSTNYMTRKISTQHVVVTIFIHLFSLLITPTSCFQYVLQAQQEITAPEMLCFSGDASTSTSDNDMNNNNNNNRFMATPSSSLNNNNIGIQHHALPCPNTIEEINNYPAMMMDEKGYVIVKLKNVILRDDGRRRSRQSNNEDEDRYLIRTTGAGAGADDKDAAHHLQIYLISLEEYKNVINDSQCCYELELQDSFKKTNDLPQECTTSSSKGSRDGSKSHDYRVNAPRIGQLASVTAPMHINVIPDTKINTNIKLRPLKRGKHLVVISNCAAELSIDPITNATLAKGIKAVIQGGIDIIFISQYGALVSKQSPLFFNS